MLDSPIKSPLRLREFLPYQLSVLSTAISRRIARLYSEEFGLTIWQWRVMAVTGDTPGISAKEIGQRTALDKVAVSRAVAGLLQLGYLERKACETDGRQSQLFLSPEGQTIYQRIIPMAKAAEQELLDSLTLEDQAELTRLMNKLAITASPGRPLW